MYIIPSTQKNGKQEEEREGEEGNLGYIKYTVNLNDDKGNKS